MNSIPISKPKPSNGWFPGYQHPLPVQSTSTPNLLMPNFAPSAEYDRKIKFQLEQLNYYQNNFHNIPQRIDYQPPTENTELRYSSYPRSNFFGQGYVYNQLPIQTLPYPYNPLGSCSGFSLMDIHVQQQMINRQRIAQKFDPNTAPLIPQIKKKERQLKQPEIIVVDDSDDNENVVQEQKVVTPPTQLPPEPQKKQVPPPQTIVIKQAPQPTRQPPPVAQKKRIKPPGTQAQAAQTVVKKTPVKTPTKPSVAQEAPVEKHLRIKIKKISKKGRVEIQRPRQKLIREKRVLISEQKIQHKKEDLHGKIRSGADHQTIIPDLSINYADYQHEKSLKLIELQSRMVWNANKHQPAYDWMRNRFEGVSCQRIIKYIKQNDQPLDELKAKTIEQEEAVRMSLETAEEPAKEAMQIEEGGRVTRGTLRSKNTQL